MMPENQLSIVLVRGVLLVTMQAEPNDSDVNDIQKRILDAMEKHSAAGLIMDLSLVETMDSFFARIVTETARMVELMGGETVIAGMRPSVALTATQLGLTLDNTKTTLDIDRALAHLESVDFHRMGG